MTKNEEIKDIKKFLHKVYKTYHKEKFIHPDPLEFVYKENDLIQREIKGIIASSLAFGNVKQILKSVSYLLNKMGGNPYKFLMSASKKDLYNHFFGFKHRFIGTDVICALLEGIKKILNTYGSFEYLFLKGISKTGSIIDGISSFVKELEKASDKNLKFLIPSPEKGSACKRINLFLRWMVRKDNIDPGGWENIPKSILLIPLDTHMHKISLILGFTNKKTKDLKTAIEITNNFKVLAPGDPVKFDFSLTRIGINRISSALLKKQTGFAS